MGEKVSEILSFLYRNLGQALKLAFLFVRIQVCFLTFLLKSGDRRVRKAPSLQPSIFML